MISIIFSLNIRKQHNTINMQISAYNRYRKQYIKNGKNRRKWKFPAKKKDDVITQNDGLSGKKVFCQKLKISGS